MIPSFISYSRKDFSAAQGLRNWLTSHGVAAWMDTDIPAGAIFTDVIESKLNQSSIIFVIWTPNSVQSRWVKEEAHKAAELGKLVPLKSVNLKASSLPFGFSRLNTIDLDDASAILRAISSHTGEQMKSPPDVTHRMQVIPNGIDIGITATARASQLAHWKLICTSRQSEDFDEFLRKYPFGDLADKARNRLKRTTIY
jgi:hypothetical protein